MEEYHSGRFAKNLLQCFSYEPTECQQAAVGLLSRFLYDPEPGILFLLKGYAGTGKTSLISAFVKVLDTLKIKNRLLAPTGRAAKVLGSYAGKSAHTIHRFIYQVYTAADGSTVIVPRQNKTPDTIYIVDEVSMIQGTDVQEDEALAFGGHNILDDLVRFVYSSDNCRMIFIGDQAQLPPVGTIISPALDKDYLESRYNLRVNVHQLEQVVRQEAESGILMNATALREKITARHPSLPLLTLSGTDVIPVSGQDLLDEMASSFIYRDDHTAVVITRSNKRANMYNQEIRRRILYREFDLEGGDLMMAVKNNYYWLPEESPAGFIANGDMLEVVRIRNTEERYGFRFADALVRLVDYPDEPALEVKLLLSAIFSENASLTRNDQMTLFHAVRDEIARSTDPEIPKGVSAHPYYNALQVKFAYALTCHKTQGGQWEKVFLDQGWLPEDKIDLEYLRWLYTAVTRATKKLFLIGFSDQYLNLTE